MPIHITVARIGQAAWLGAALVWLLPMLAGMREEAARALAPMFLFSGVQLGALMYGSKHGKRRCRCSTTTRRAAGCAAG